jgi:hypothetical protein
VRDGMVNPARSERLDELADLLDPVVRAARQILRDRLDDQVAAVTEKLARTRRRLEAWQVRAREVVERMPPGAHQNKRRADVERVTHQITALIDDHRPTDAPLVRVVGALLPRDGARS